MSRLISANRFSLRTLGCPFASISDLTLCMLCTVSFLSFAEFLRSFIIYKLNSAFRNTIRFSNSLDPDQTRQNVGPELGPN